MLFDEGGVAFVAEGLGVGGFLADEAEAGDAAAFLVDGDEGLDVGEVAEVIDEFAELFGADDVAAEEDEAAGLEFFEAGGGGGVEFGAGNAGEEELAEEVCVGHRGEGAEGGAFCLKWGGLPSGFVEGGMESLQAVQNWAWFMLVVKQALA